MLWSASFPVLYLFLCLFFSNLGPRQQHFISRANKKKVRFLWFKKPPQPLTREFFFARKPYELFLAVLSVQLPFFSSIIKKYALEWRKKTLLFLKLLCRDGKIDFVQIFVQKRSQITEVVSRTFYPRKKMNPGREKPCHFCLYGKKKDCKSFSVWQIDCRETPFWVLL